MAESPPIKAPKRGPGRPKGLPKTGGRQKAPKLPEELRRYVSDNGRPLDVLMAVAKGNRVKAASPANTAEKTWCYPTLTDRMTAARILVGKILPDLRAVELAGPGGSAIPLGEPDPFELARRVAFLLALAAPPEVPPTEPAPAEPVAPPAPPPLAHLLPHPLDAPEPAPPAEPDQDELHRMQDRIFRAPRPEILRRKPRP